MALDLARDASVFLGDFGVTVTNGAESTTGLLSTQEEVVDVGGFAVQRRTRVLRLKTGTGGTITIGTLLTIGGEALRVDGIEKPEADEVFTMYRLAGGAS